METVPFVLLSQEPVSHGHPNVAQQQSGNEPSVQQANGEATSHEPGSNKQSKSLTFFSNSTEQGNISLFYYLPPGVP